ncbi:transporter substrate-binding domain-containing protein [Nocardioides caldifontis]|uniref:transporter substrate-binding domain-containing protein n=1 Tax=Nocardioides caldifontis TaxID=2588938 RepID=UPI001396CCEB|nr:transporter substrate-binding domain-containing protein [Nocardioides caldifontis]
MHVRRLAPLALLTVLGLLAACGDAEPESGSGGGGGGGSSADPAGGTVCETTDAEGDLLAQICDKGVLTVSTDAAYPPQSRYVPKEDKWEGFDIDVATEIANRLGVDIAWETPSWDVITAGGWNGRWDLSVGSMTPTNDRQEVLHFTEPYYFTPSVVLVHEDNSTIQDLENDLDGKTIGVCAGCTYEQFLDKSLDIQGFEFDFVVDDATIKGYDTDTTALQDLALGDGTRLDAAMTSLTVAQGYVDEGNPVKIVGDPLFYEPLSVAIDKSADLDPASLVEATDQIVQEMHEDGTLTGFSENWFGGTDLTKQQQ